MTDLGNLNNGDATTPYGVSADGNVVVGLARDASLRYRAFVWTQAGGIVSLGTLNGGNSSMAKAVSGDGSVVVGTAQDGTNANRNTAFRWTAASGIVSLGMMNGGPFSQGLAVSADGSVVVGSAYDGASQTRNTAFRWTQAGGMTSLGMLNGGNTSQAQGVNSDGSVVVGVANDGANRNASTAFRWTQTGGMVSLGMLNGGLRSEALAVNANGDVVVGQANADSSGTSRAIRWTQATGMITVEQWLRNNGATIPTDVTVAARGISADGTTIVGELANGHPFIARGPVGVTQTPVTTPPTTTPGVTPSQPAPFVAAAGLMDVVNFQASLGGTPRTAPQLQTGDMIVNGAHSSPLTTLLAPGRSAVWTAGDVAVAGGGGGFDAGSGLGEGGIAHGFEHGVTVKFGVGGVASRTPLALGGASNTTGTYVVPEASMLFGPGLVATVTGYLNWGTADIRRGYLNANSQDISFGSTATLTAGARARLDWQDALRLGKTGFSPYASITYLNTRLDAYIETGGSFPVRFDASHENSTVARIGGDMLTPLTEQLGLVTRLEYAHRFERTGAATTGQILGLSNFAFDSGNVKQDWGRAGLGLRYRLGPGDGLIMVNTSNQTNRNLTWLSASYRIVF